MKDAYLEAKKLSKRRANVSAEVGTLLTKAEEINRKITESRIELTELTKKYGDALGTVMAEMIKVTKALETKVLRQLKDTGYHIKADDYHINLADNSFFYKKIGNVVEHEGSAFKADTLKAALVGCSSAYRPSLGKKEREYAGPNSPKPYLVKAVLNISEHKATVTPVSEEEFYREDDHLYGLAANVGRSDLLADLGSCILFNKDRECFILVYFNL